MCAVMLLLFSFFSCIETPTTDFNFSITNPGNITLEPGKSKEVEIFVRGLSVDAQKVHIEITGLPKGITVSLDPPRGTPGFISKVRYSAATDMATGVYPFEVIARGEKGKEMSYSSEIRVIENVSCVAKYSGPVSVLQYWDSVRFIYSSFISCTASDSGLFHIENFANRSIKVKGFFDCTTEVIEIPEQKIGSTIIRGSGRVFADSLFIMGSLQDGFNVEYIREFYWK